MPACVLKLRCACGPHLLGVVKLAEMPACVLKRKVVLDLRIVRAGQAGRNASLCIETIVGMRTTNVF